MGASYYIYTEAFINDKWICLCPYVKKLSKDADYTDENKDSNLVMVDTYWNGSRSYFGSTYEKIRDIGQGIDHNELSEEIQKRHPYDEQWHYPVMVSMTYEQLQRYTPPENKKDHCAFVPKTEIFEFENGGEEIWNWIDAKEHKRLSKEEKEYYQLYEWDEYDGWAIHFKDIRRAVNRDIALYEDINYMQLKDSKIRIVMIAYP